MIRVLKILVVLGLLWSAWWYGAGYMMRRSIANWFDAQQEHGWQADYAAMSTSGYPLHLITALDNPALADPATGIAWQADWLHLQSPAIWPGWLSLQFPASPQRLSWLDRTAVIAAQDMHADLHLAPGLGLELERMALQSGPLSVRREDGTLFTAQTIAMTMVQTDRPEVYDIDLDAAGVIAGPLLRDDPVSNSTLPETFGSLAVTMRVGFDRPWDRRALEERRPQPAAIDLSLAQIEWGPLQVKAAGNVTVDEQGFPDGQVTLKAVNWRDMLVLARESGALSPRSAAASEQVLSMLSGIGGKGDALDATLALRNGKVYFGLLPLGPAPRLILR